MDNKTNSSEKKENSFEVEKLLLHVLAPAFNRFVERRQAIKVVMTISFVLAVILVIIPVINPHFQKSFYGAGFGALVFFITVIMRFNSRLDTRITKAGLIYLPITKFAFQDKSIVVDRSGLSKTTEFNYPNLLIKNIPLVAKNYDCLNHLVRTMPPLLSSDKKAELQRNFDSIEKNNIQIFSQEINYLDYIKHLDELYQTINEFKITLPVLEKNDPLLNFFEEETAHEPEDDLVYEELTPEMVENDLHQITGIVEIETNKKHEELHDIDELTLDIVKFLSDSSLRWDYVLNKSLSKINIENSFLFSQYLGQSSYNYYCPSCNKENIEKLQKPNFDHNNRQDMRITFPKNTIVRIVDVGNRVWKCPLCAQETEQPFPVHKMLDELFNKVYDKLYEENYKERLAIYNKVNDEKRKYIEKAESQLHQVRRESRSSIDSIKSKIRSLSAELSADQQSIQSLSNLMLKYKRISEERVRNFQSDIMQIKKEIDEESNKAKAELTSVIEGAKQRISEDLDQQALLARIDQEKRDAVQRDIANNTQQIVNNTQRIADNTGLIADIELARAEKEGLRDKPFWRDPFKGLRNFSYSLQGKDEIEKAHEEKKKYI